MHRGKLLAAALAILALLGTTPHFREHATGSFKLTIPSGPFISGSRFPIETLGINGPAAYSVVGPGAIANGEFEAPSVDAATKTTIVAAATGALAYGTITIVPPPAPRRALIAVAAYESGVALHDPKTFALLGYAPIGGPPGDVAFSINGNIAAPDTDGDTLAQIARAPWQLRAVGGVPAGNEVAVDERTGNVFVSNRELNGKGGLTRITPDGTLSHVITGDTAEGLAIDSARGIVYVGNVNSASVAAVDAASMTVLRKIRSVDRTFGIALDAKAQRLYVVSNNSPAMHPGGGFVAAIDLRRSGAPIVSKSKPMTFPLGVALDAGRSRLFVTDESADDVYVLSDKTLRAVRSPLQTCRTPWRPRIAAGRLYVPCARSNTIDVFDLSTLRRVKGAPFATGGFPLSVALWP
jgi:DNA-binding beta-propeller fold protein YncE